MSESLNSSTNGSDDHQRPSNSGKTRVLVVDDDRDICQFLEIALGTLGHYEVEIATCASEAFLALDSQTEPFDCLLLDIQMPMMTGVTLCDAIRRIPGYQTVPIIMLTAMGERKYLDDAFAAGATDYMTKPFDLTELRTRIGRSRRDCALPAHGSGSETSLAQTDPGSLANNMEQAQVLSHIDRCVTDESFENYVVQSFRQEFRNSFVRAVNIVNFQHLVAALPTREVQAILFEVGSMIAEATTKTGGVLSYRGDGVFLYMGHGKCKLAPKIVREKLRKNCRLAGIYEDFNLNAEVVVGDPVQLHQYTRSDVLFALNDAMLNLQDTDTPSHGWKSFSEWRSAKSKRGVKRDRIEQRAYELILRDMLMERGQSNKPG